MKSKILTGILYSTLVVIWYFILSYGQIIFLFTKPLITYFMNGLLKLVFLILFASVFLLPIIFRKKLTKNWMKPFAMLILTPIVCICFLGILNISKHFISNFNQDTWTNYPELRIYMIEDIEEEYELLGKTEQEIIDLLGNPSNISSYRGRVYEYFISSGFMDPVTYDIVFENGISVSAEKMHH